MAALTVAPVYAQTFIYVDPATVIVQACEEFTVDVNVESVVDLYAWEIWMSFDPTLIDYISIEQGPFLPTAGNTIWLYFIDETAGTIHAFGVLLQSPPVPGMSGSGTLANVTFHCSGPGECVLDLFDTTLLNPSAEWGSAPPWICQGDANLDGVVDIVDAVIVAKILGGADPYNPNADFDGNGIVDLIDLLTVALNFGNTCPGDVLRPINNVISHSTIDGQVTQTAPPEPPVGGVWAPVNVFELLAPWIAVALIALAAAAAGTRHFFIKR